MPFTQDLKEIGSGLSVGRNIRRDLVHGLAHTHRSGKVNNSIDAVQCAAHQRHIRHVSNDELRMDVLNAIHEVKARGAKVVGISPENAEQFIDWLKVPDTKETSAIMNIIPFQLLAYYMALARGNNIDKPRNIAKSVTVK